MVKLTVSNTHFLYYVQPYVRRAVHSIKCVLLMVRLTRTWVLYTLAVPLKLVQLGYKYVYIGLVQ